MGILDAPVSPASIGAVPKWKANTAYTAGTQVLAPNGDIVSAIATFTSGATYSAANWNASLALATANFLADSTLTQKVKKAPDNITWITQFQAGHGWTTSNPTEINLNSTEVKLSGSQGVKYGPAAPGTFKTLESQNPISPALDLSGKVLVIAVKALDNNGQGLEVWLANAAFSAYRIYYPDPLNYQTEDGWTFLTIHTDANTGGTGSLTMTAVERIRIRVSNPTSSHTEYIGGVGYAPIPATYPNGVVTIDFDDNATGQFELARPLMMAKGYPGSIYPIGDTADSRADGAMSVADMHMLEDLYGWEIGAHSRLNADHVSMQTLTDAQIEDSILRMRQWLTSKGFKANVFAYPNGGSDTRVRNVARRYFSLGRRTGWTPLMMNDPMTSGHFTYGAAFNTTSASITTLIDAAAARKQWLALGFHGFISGASSGANMGTTDFGVVLDYIQSKGMAVVTPSTLFGLKR